MLQKPQTTYRCIRGSTPPMVSWGSVGNERKSDSPAALMWNAWAITWFHPKHVETSVSRKIDPCKGQLGLNASRFERLGGKMQEYPQMRVLRIPCQLHTYFMEILFWSQNMLMFHKKDLLRLYEQVSSIINAWCKTGSFSSVKLPRHESLFTNSCKFNDCFKDLWPAGLKHCFI